MEDRTTGMWGPGPVAVVPDHVPPELVWHDNLYRFVKGADDPYVAAARLHGGPPVIWASESMFGGSNWIVTRFGPMAEALADYRRFQAWRGKRGPNGAPWRLTPIHHDPPDHRGYRNLLNPYFAPAAIRAMDGAMRATCDALIAPLADRDGCEFMGDFAIRFPSTIFFDLMGMPGSMMPTLLRWERHLMRGTPRQRFDATEAVIAYLTDFLAEQRTRPTSSLMARLTSARLGKRMLEHDELMGMAFLLFLSGFETVYSVLGWVFRHLALDQQLQARLRSRPADIGRAVDEFLRAFAVAVRYRSVARDIDFHGAPLRRGDTLILPTYLAARDPLAYDDPHRIDIDRCRRHLSFGGGMHACPGNRLAKQELSIAIEAFLARFDNIRIPAGKHCAFHSDSVLGLDCLPLVWERIG